MAISFPASEEAANKPQLNADERPTEPSLLTRAAQLLNRGYERLNSAIFDADGDCMRL